MGDELLLGGDAHAGQRIMGLWLLGKLNSALDQYGLVDGDEHILWRVDL